jgi:hypothetical protein
VAAGDVLGEVQHGAAVDPEFFQSFVEEDMTRAETPAVVAASIDSDKRMDPPQIPGCLQVHGEETIRVSTGGRDPVTGTRYPGSVYTESRVGVGASDPRVGGPPTADPRYPPGDPRNPDPGVGGASQGASSQSLYDKLDQKALPEGMTTKAVAGYVYFPKIAPRR